MQSSFQGMLHACRDGARHLMHRLGGRLPVPEVEPPAGALLGADQMEQHGRLLAASHRLDTRRLPDRLLGRLADNEAVLLDACKVLTEALKANRRIAPAGEWLLDNFYLIEEQIRTARRHLPRGYSLELPRLAEGPSMGLPRVYDIVLEAISHSDGRVDASGLARFVASYQQVTVLKLGELWAVPIMLRLALIENLRRVGARLAASTADKDRADAWADWMLSVAERDPKSLILVVADMARSNPPMASSFVAELARRLQGQSAALALPLTWIEQRLAESGLTIEQLVQSEGQKQAAGQVSISNSIASLRLGAATDWRGFVESISRVESTLGRDPAQIYLAMDFATRDSYRHVVESLARSSPRTEEEVAQHAVRLAQQAADEPEPDALAPAASGAGRAGADGADARARHVGYWLVGGGRADLERSIDWAPSALQTLKSMARRRPLACYLGAILLLTVLLAGGMATPLRGELASDGLRVLVLLLILAVANHLAVALVNWGTTLLSKPVMLPRMDFASGIPVECRTLVVVPSMLRSADDVESLCEGLEVRFLGNRDPNIHFALLTDFEDAATETVPGDAALLDLVSLRITELNRKFAASAGEMFFLLHRARSWNAQEGVWMGRERKRGKLAALNRLLRGSTGPEFAQVDGRVEQLSGTRYVITLDTDTRLPRETARQFIATLAHPLNRACYDPDRSRVVDGYGILQPRVADGLAGAGRSRYARLFGSDAGLDPYTRAVSDVYQDLFGEGSFIGKGIYDIDAFESALAGCLPENRILSHDLLEGCYARSALLSDVLLYEDAPATYGLDAARHARWMRGDWQIASWMLPQVPGGSMPAGQAAQPNPLTALSRWKIFDNLRRSLIPAALVGLLLIGWFRLHAPLLWTAIVLGSLVAPGLLVSLADLFRKPADLQFGLHLQATLRTSADRLQRGVFGLASLLQEALAGLHATALSSWRIAVSRRHLLEWTASAAAQRADGHTLFGNCLRFRASALAALVLLCVLAWIAPAALPVAAPVLLLWIALPALAWSLSRPQPPHTDLLDAAQHAFLRDTARQTWAFFEACVGPADHWLPPDNLQEYPTPVIAHRTSPTNIGLSLLANLAAHDLGLIAQSRLLARTAAALESMGHLERHHGHFCNWYDTERLEPLAPLYLSTVDSGNLVAHLLTLRVGLAALADAPVLGPQWRAGLCDARRALDNRNPDPIAHGTGLLAQLDRDLDALKVVDDASLMAVHARLLRLSGSAARLSATVAPASAPAASPGAAEIAPGLSGAEQLCRLVAALLAELEMLAPWITRTPPSERLRVLLAREALPTLAAVASGCVPACLPKFRPGMPEVLEQLESHGGVLTPAELGWRDALGDDRARGVAHAAARLAEIERLIRLTEDYGTADFCFLYDRSRHLLSIGFNLTEQRRDPGFYDMLASEARLASFFAIAQGQLPQEHWFALGRLLVRAGDKPTLVSWSGSMFEYLMPELVMPNYPDTLLDQTYRAVVERQIQYGQERGVPWGVSESGYNAVDTARNYQYRAFGVPGLGLKAGLADDLVVTPYATALALMVFPLRACQNLKRLAADGLHGRFGFFEAIDYTPSRLPRRQTSVVVRSFMAHHQGMILLSLTHVLADRIMQRRFSAEPAIQATLLLLQERVPRMGVLRLHTGEFSAIRSMVGQAQVAVRILATANTSAPAVQLLSNGNYHVMVSNAGGGYSRWKELAITRWREDPTRDHWGSFCYLRDVDSGALWSNAHQPTLHQADSYEVIFSEGRAEFRRRDFDLDTHTEIVVSPEDDIELRRLHLTNRSRLPRTIELTSYAEVVLAPPAADAMHPCFGNLFVQTEIVAEQEAILCTRRPRSPDESPHWMVHMMTVRGPAAAAPSFETDRARFIGRDGSLAAPLALKVDAPLSGTMGSVLDPVVAVRQRVTIAPRETVVIDLVTGIAPTREAALALAIKHRDRHLADRVFDLAWTHSQVVLRQINATEADAQLYATLAGSVIYAEPGLRAEAGLLARNRRGQSGLWGYSISGDLPLVLVQVAESGNIELVRQMVQAHAYWRLKGLAVDLVVWNEDQAGYRQQLQEQILGLIAAGIESHVADRRGSVFVRRADQMSEEERVLVQAVARVIVSDRRGSLADQARGRGQGNPLVPRQPPARLIPGRAWWPDVAPIPFRPADPALQFDNGRGGFAPDGREYVIVTGQDHSTPAPWVNVLANVDFGTVVSQSGTSTTWSENAQEFRLSPWHNDPVQDPGGEAIYLRDDESGHYWSVTPLPCPGVGPYRTRHGFGYSCFEHTETGIQSELTVFVALDGAIKCSILKLRNLSGRTRSISATCYVEWVLGDARPKTAMHTVSEVIGSAGTLTARNAFNSDFPERLAFLDTDDMQRTWTCDRSEFIGRNGSLARPAALQAVHLSNASGAGLDPCAALQVSALLDDGREQQWVFRLGCGRTPADASALVERWRGVAAALQGLEDVRRYWRRTLGAIQVTTPDAALNLLANGWLLYQTLASRLWGRTGYYQSSGAYGFRDQLQDVMALMHAEPRLAREQLLRSAARQYPEGDAQHWWHPTSGRGIRTRCSDDFLWLPLVACRYVRLTGDATVLDETVHFIEGRPVAAGEDSYFDLPLRSEQSATLYQHCVLAIRHGLAFGVHGLPLMGSGDWNDGMNLVGIAGKGESVWLGFFLHKVLEDFARLAQQRGDDDFAAVCLLAAEQLARDIDAHAWDGDWYLRAWFDDGSPLGSASNDECQIDAIAQSWSVLSGVGSGDRARQAMQALDARLVQPEGRLIQLLAPPFDHSTLNPGYIRGYVPGVRENGGQYTHAAVWSVMAFAALGDTERAWALFDLINPISHALDARAVERYKVEPYVVAADVYAVDPHRGRGGWTWYTGSAGWMYRLLIESLLGVRREASSLWLEPRLPAAWPQFSFEYRYLETRYLIRVVRGDDTPDPARLTIDGQTAAGLEIALVDDRRDHHVELVLAGSQAPPLSLPTTAPRTLSGTPLIDRPATVPANRPGIAPASPQIGRRS